MLSPTSGAGRLPRYQFLSESPQLLRVRSSELLRDPAPLGLLSTSSQLCPFALRRLLAGPAGCSWLPVSQAGGEHAGPSTRSPPPALCCDGGFSLPLSHTLVYVSFCLSALLTAGPPALRPGLGSWGLLLNICWMSKQPYRPASPSYATSGMHGPSSTEEGQPPAASVGGDHSAAERGRGRTFAHNSPHLCKERV